MSVSGVTTTQNTAAVTAAAKDSLGKEDFLRLFTAQLRSQNPLNPMDGADFTAQLAQFSSLEQLTNLNDQMNNLVLFQGSLQNTLTAGLIGKQVRTESGGPHTVTGVLFENGAATLVLNDGSTASLGDIREITGGTTL